MTKLMISISLVLGSYAVAEDPAIGPEEGLPRISWENAAAHYDETCIVIGKVIATKEVGQRTFLNFDEDFKTTFTAVIHRDHYAAFPSPPGAMYDQQYVRVRGRIVEFQGKPEIMVTSPSQITVITEDEARAALGEPPSDASGAAALPAASQPTTRSVATNGTFSMATYNVLNLFDEYDDPYTGDETTPMKPREQLEKLARSLRELDADVVAFQEVENRGYLQRFVDVFLKDMGYKEVVLFEGNYYRGVDVALISRFPVGPATSYRHLRFADENGADTQFQRDLLQATIEPPDAPSFDVFVVHLKSKHNGPEKSLPIRMAEARKIREILDGVLANRPRARFLLCGDFNDTFDSKPLQTILGHGDGKLVSFLDGAPPDRHPTYNKRPHLEMIDFIFASPAMAETFVQGSYRIVPGSIEKTGSDHNPVACRFRLSPATPATQPATLPGNGVLPSH